MGKFQSSIGSTNGTTSQFLVNDGTEATQPSTNDYFMVESTDMLDDLYAKATKGNICLDDIMVIAAHAVRPKGIDTYHLSKIWRIHLDSAKRTLEVTSHHSTRSDNHTLCRNYGTNDRMLRYKIIKGHFFMYTFFSTNTRGKYLLCNTCYQLLGTYKGVVYVFPMKIK